MAEYWNKYQTWKQWACECLKSYREKIQLAWKKPEVRSAREIVFPLSVVFLLSLLVAVILGPPEDPWKGVLSARREWLKKLDAENPPRADAVRAAAGERFNARFNAYRDNLGTLDTNLKLQGFLSVIALALVLSRKTTGDHEVLGMRAPVTVLRWLVPLALVFLWLQFGYLLHHVIDARLTLWHMLPVVDSPPHPGAECNRGGAAEHDVSMPTADVPDAWEAGANLAPESPDLKVSTRQSLLNDGGLLDAYFRAFQPQRYHSGLSMNTGGRWLNVAVVFAVYGVILGGGHAAILSMLYLGAFPTTPGRSPGSRGVYFLGASLALVVIWWSYFQFCYGGPNRSWLAFVIGACSIAFSGIVVWAARRREIRRRAGLLKRLEALLGQHTGGELSDDERELLGDLVGVCSDRAPSKAKPSKEINRSASDSKPVGDPQP